MNPEISVYGLPKGETERYTETLLACFSKTPTAELNIARIIEAASADGFHSFRVAGFAPGTRPDFTTVLNPL